MNRSTLCLLVYCASACAADSPDAGTTQATTTDATSTDDPSTTSPSTTDSTTTMSSSSGPDPATSTVDPTSADASSESTDAESTGGPIEPGPDLRELGPHATSTTTGSASTSCSMGYTITAPDDVADAPTVILAHGFQGNRASMADWAAHYASWGLVVVTPDLCHATIIDPDHAQNGVDLVALADHLELAAPIYAGYSAGGLSAVLAAAQDPDALALVGLDMVDSGGLGADVAASIAIPAHDVTAEPAMCNSTANGVPVFGAIPDGATLRIVEADHCDFQSPPDAFCGLCSAPNPGFTDEQIAASIRGLTTAALLWRSGLDESGAQWWTPGAPWFDMLVEAGAMNQL